MPGGYMLTAHSTGLGWRDVAVIGTTDIREAIAAAERITGCRVSHGRGGGIGSGFDPGVTINLETGEVIEHHSRKAKPVVDFGPPDVLRAIAMALKAPPKAAPRRKTGPRPEGET